MHGTARRAAHRHGHKRRLETRGLGCLPNQALEVEHFIGLAQGIAVHEVNLQLTLTHLLDGPSDLNVMEPGVIMHDVDKRRIFTHGFHLKGSGAPRRTTGEAGGSRQWLQRIGIGRDEVKFRFLGHHGLEAHCRQLVDQVLQDGSRRNRQRLSRQRPAVANAVRRLL